jgi:DNA-binding beta-propeller fold protein YncE
MRAWGLPAAVLLFAAWVAGCGGNSTTVGITITGPALPPLAIIVNQSAQFTATVTGISTSTVFWQICEPPAVPSTTIPPTMCTAGQGPATGCTIASVQSPITGFGTITANGLYTAPATVPSPAKLLIVATSCIRANAFSTFQITIDSGIRVQVFPSSASLGPGETFQFTDQVTGTNDTGVVWQVNTIPGGNATVGFICPSGAAGNPCTPGTAPGEYFAPPASPTTSITVAAQSGADPTEEGTATVTIGTGNAPGFSATNPLDPSVAAEGSVQQDVYINGTDLLSTTQVLVNNVAVPVANVSFINSTLIRVTIPAAQLTHPGPINIVLESQAGANSSGTQQLQVDPVRPVVIASTPDSVGINNGGASLTASLVGGYFVPNTTAIFNGVGCGGGGQVCTTYVDSRHLTVSIQDASLSSPGLYPLVVQDPDALAAGVPSVSGLNLAVNPNPLSISSGPGTTVTVGAGPSAIAIDEADGIAVVANTTAGTVSLVNLKSVPPTVIGGAITVGTAPTGVAVDDMLPHHMAYVVNSGNNTVSAIDLSLATPAVVQTLSLASYEPSVIPSGTVPWTIGANPLTHRAYIANQSTNVGTILDLANANTSLVPPCTAPPCPVAIVTGGITPFGTGIDPQVAIDPRLNWAMATPGGTGTSSIVDLGRAPSQGDVGRLPELIGSLSISPTVQGIGINTETHEALLADPSASTLTTFSLLNDAVTSVTFRVAGVTLDSTRLAAAAVTPLENVGIAVQDSLTGATGVVADLDSGVVLKQITGLGGEPEAVAVDPASNQAVIANAGDGTVSILSLGPTPTPPQILEASPATTLTDAAVNLVLTGANFSPASVIRLDQGITAIGGMTLTPTAATGCSGGSCRQLTATIPAGTLTSARRYLVDVENPGGVVSNLTDLAVIQAVPVGTTPVGVAVDTDRDLAVVTNSIDNSASLVSLTPIDPNFSPQSLGPVGVIGSPISTGTTPEGVAVDPRLGVAVVANNGSNDATAIDVTTTPALPTNVPLCGSPCLDPVGVAFDNDGSIAVITNTNSNNLFSTGEVASVGVSRTTTTTSTSITATLAGEVQVDQDPVAVAVDPKLDLAGVATASSTSSLDLVDLASQSIVGRVNNLQNPSGVVFDPVNQIFVTVNSLLNNIFFTDPNTSNSTTVAVGIAPTSVDYNFQTSSLVTVNAGSHTMSVLDYTCPPNTAPTCQNPQVRAVLSLGGAQTTTLVLGPNAVAIDPKLNLAVLVDPDNNRVLLVPLPH